MATSNGDSLTELERQAEVNRAELAQTVDELHNRVSPQTLKEDMRNYARERGQHVLETLEARARENPLQAVAIAAGVGYPLWRMIASVPAPLLMIGAGLALSGRSSSTGYRNGGRWRSGNGQHEGDALYAHASSESNGGGIAGLGRQISEKVSETVSTVRHKASEATTTAKERLQDTYRSSSDTAGEVMHQAGERYMQTRDSMVDMFERHPFLVGGIAFAIGSLVASSLPVTRQESRLMGQTSEAVRRRTEGLAAQGLEQAKSAARDIYETASSVVKEEGLSPDAARQTVRAAVESARGAVEHTMEGGAAAQPRGRSGRSSRNQST